LKISIITTTFNGAATIRDCLESIIEQTHPNVEHIVVDAASTDGTLDILEEYKKDSRQSAVEVSASLRLSGSRQYKEGEFRMISEPDNGIYDGMNKGLRLATGDVVGILNADDFYFGPDVLGKVAGVFEDLGVDSCYGDLVYVAEGKKSCQSSAVSYQSKSQGTTSQDFRVVRYWKSGPFDYRKFWWGWMPPHPTFFVRRSVYERYGYFNLEMGTAADYELMLRFLVKHRITAAYLSEILIQMRSGGASNVTLAARLRANRMDRKAWEVNGLKPYPWTLMMKPLRKVGQWVSRPRP
jgi:glycosyltransferase